MRVFLIGQKWLGAEVLSLLQRRGHDVAGVSAPDGDRLFKAAGALALPQGKLTADLLPDKLDLIVCAHAHVFVKAELRDRARLGAIVREPQDERVATWEPSYRAPAFKSMVQAG